MANKKIIEKLQMDMEMRSFSKYTKGDCLRKAKEVVKYFGKPKKNLKSFLSMMGMS